MFKDKGTQTHLHPPAVVNYQWAPKGLYCIEQMLGMIKQLPKRINMFTEKGFAIYVLGDYVVLLTPEIRQEFTQPVVTCSKLIMETLEQSVKYVQN